MSLDTRFSSLTFPSLRSEHQETLDVQARASGHAAGYAAGLRAAGQELAEQVARLDAEHEATLSQAQARLDRAIGLLAAAANALAERTVPVLTEVQDAIAESAMDLAEELLGTELSIGDTSATAAMKRALSSVDASLVHTVRMNALDLAVFDEQTLAATGVTFTADSSLARGDAITEFPVGYLDARITTAVARARAAILGEAS
ncbi:MAG: flagellar assembly protein [Microbacteriaceae bacterium]|jgi:flagellar assembly protein FliH|nr:flagellar assembly protein [Microbacteriaceae bacterium]